ncbi:hypothetical protein EB241_06200 [Erwinia psidii]|uniref:Uncharacterized protein n=1 Tax=Erwinia psidii TaxID=69224 RepID=A0A3N6SNJ9_9GAMM|nr:hypothetical protein EB241_06200 [Erwinia psidii]
MLIIRLPTKTYFLSVKATEAVTHTVHWLRRYEYDLAGNKPDAPFFAMRQSAVIRKTNHPEDYFFPAEVMLAIFLQKYRPLNTPEIHDTVP